PNMLDSARIAVPPQAVLPQAVLPQAVLPQAVLPQAAPPPAAVNDITGAITTLPPVGGRLAMIAVPPTERLPDSIGGPALRAAALKGDPAAAYEIGMRFAEGKG